MASADLIETVDNGVAWLRLNRPERRNALDLALRQALAAAIRRLDQDDQVRCIVLAGDGAAFASGADLTEMKARRPADPQIGVGRVLGEALAARRKPVVAAVRGYALGGGCELALQADVIIAGAGAIFGFPEVRLGIVPGAGGTQRLVRAVGPQQAAVWLLTGEPMNAATALRIGLVAEVVEDDQVEGRAGEVASRIAAAAPMAVEAARELITLGAEAPLATALVLERYSFERLLATSDFVEGMQAFFDKRPPRFTGS